MHHWSTRYLGTPYDAQGADCADSVARVLCEQFAARICLPGRARGLRARDAQLTAALGTLAAPVETPVEGDLALLRAAGRIREVGRHVGVWCESDGAGYVLHATVGAGACLHPADDLARYGFELAGVYRWAGSAGEIGARSPPPDRPPPENWYSGRWPTSRPS